MKTTIVGTASAVPAPIPGLGDLVESITENLSLGGSITRSTTNVTGSASGTAVVIYTDGPQVVDAINKIANLSDKARVTIEGLDFTPQTIRSHPDIIKAIAQQFEDITALVQSDITAIAMSPKL
ncbi:hypothetical protein ACMFMG_007434 [Clarireedia jacksonii]